MKNKILHTLLNESSVRILGVKVNYQPIKNKLKKRFPWLKEVKRVILNQPSVPVSSKAKKTEDNTVDYYSNPPNLCRPCISTIKDEIDLCDVLSLDIFDTAIYRSVEDPKDVFEILALSMNRPDFKSIRMTVERELRAINKQKTGSPEVTLDGIYSRLSCRYDVDPVWSDEERKLEVALSNQDQYVHELYEYALSKGKEVIFVSDMYLDLETIRTLLGKNGYSTFRYIYLSNIYSKTKGYGTLYEVVKNDLKGNRILHIGDDEHGDYKKAKLAGLNAIWLPKAFLNYKERNVNGLCSSFYRSLIAHKMFEYGLSAINIQYEHGYRVGGVLCAGFCQFIKSIVQTKSIDSVLFCSRDCEIIAKVYKEFFKTDEKCYYVKVSRYAIFNVMSKSYLYDIISRFILGSFRENRTKKYIGQILAEAGYGYLCDYLEDYDIEKYAFPCDLQEDKVVEFFYGCADIIEKNNQSSKKAAEKYFRQIISQAKNILIVDVGWSGTCITALKKFIRDELNIQCNVFGALMCSSRSNEVKSSLTSNTLFSYIFSPFKNVELCNFMHPLGKVTNKDRQLLHMPLEYLFTSTEGSLYSYAVNSDGTIGFLCNEIKPKNVRDIKSMQQGIYDFCRDYQANTQKIDLELTINPYTAFMPLMEAIKRPEYSYCVYKRFLHEFYFAPFKEPSSYVEFGSQYDIKKGNVSLDERRKNILFVNPSMNYNGSPVSSLRMAKIAKKQGYGVLVWSKQEGPFIKEFAKNDIDVMVVGESELKKESILRIVKSINLAICNVIATDKYACFLSKHIPTVWYIREAENIPSFLANDKSRAEFLRDHGDAHLYCVSDYAAAAISKFTNQEINVLENSVEDRAFLVDKTCRRDSNTVRFIQLGTIEYRKGYDVLIEAFSGLPEEYKARAEIIFAGGLMPFVTPFVSYLFRKINKLGLNRVKYLGVIENEKQKINAIANSDVVVVASRDESCSLVALEGVMLSKPLIVSENVGAKYLVSEENGFVVPTGNPEALRTAMMYFIDHKDRLNEMGKYSRKVYENRASIQRYEKDLGDLFKKFTSEKLEKPKAKQTEISVKHLPKDNSRCVVTLTSNPPRISTIHLTINSLLNQTEQAEKIILYLSEKEFTSGDNSLPEELKKLERGSNKRFEIYWVKEDFKGYNRYFYPAQQSSGLPILVVDDGYVYSKNLIESLLAGYRRFPDSISCGRVNLITFREKSDVRPYWAWPKNYTKWLDMPSYQLIGVSSGGVLYPPSYLTTNLLIKDGTIENIDDELWIKFQSVLNGVKTVAIGECTKLKSTCRSQCPPLYEERLLPDIFDKQVQDIFAYLESTGVDTSQLIEMMRKDCFC